MADRGSPVRVEGLREFRRALKRVSPEVDRELRAAARKIGETVAAEARAHAIKQTGEYARSIRPYVTAKGVSIGSRLPQAGVLHWGGTIRPRGVPIVFRPRPVIRDAADRQVAKTIDRFGDAVEQAAVKAGWK